MAKKPKTTHYSIDKLGRMRKLKGDPTKKKTKSKSSSNKDGRSVKSAAHRKAISEGLKRYHAQQKKLNPNAGKLTPHGKRMAAERKAIREGRMEPRKSYVYDKTFFDAKTGAMVGGSFNTHRAISKAAKAAGKSIPDYLKSKKAKVYYHNARKLKSNSTKKK